MVSLSGVSLVQLRRFLMLSEELHFSRTAERLGISQPLLSGQIADLEAQLKLKLFNRSSRRVELTPAGALLKDRVALIVLALEEAVKAARDIHGGGNTPLRIGYTDEFISFILPDLTRYLHLKDIGEVILTSDTVPELVKQLNSGLIDLALLSPMSENPPDEDWEVITFVPLQLSVGLCSDHPLSSESVLTIQQLAEEVFIECPTEAESASEVLVNRLFARHGLRRKITQRLEDPHLAIQLAAAGVGMFIANFRHEHSHKGLTVIPLQDADAVLTCAAVCRKSNQTTLLQACRTYLQSVGSAPSLDSN
jgi:DNA-binding transcriptional LysR family regulator